MKQEQLNKLGKMPTANAVHVRLLCGADSQRDYYFGSLAAIYEVFTSQELGVPLYALYEKVSYPYITERCVINKIVIHRKPQKRC